MKNKQVTKIMIAGYFARRKQLGPFSRSDDALSSAITILMCRGLTERERPKVGIVSITPNKWRRL